MKAGNSHHILEQRNPIDSIGGRTADIRSGDRALAHLLISNPDIASETIPRLQVTFALFQNFLHWHTCASFLAYIFLGLLISAKSFML